MIGATIPGNRCHAEAEAETDKEAVSALKILTGDTAANYYGWSFALVKPMDGPFGLAVAAFREKADAAAFYTTRPALLRITGDTAANFSGFPFVVQDPNDPETIDGTEYGIPLAAFREKADAEAFVAAKEAK